MSANRFDTTEPMLIEFFHNGKTFVVGKKGKNSLVIKNFEGTELKSKFRLSTREDVQCLYDVLGQFLNGEFE